MLSTMRAPSLPPVEEVRSSTPPTEADATEPSTPEHSMVRGLSDLKIDEPQPESLYMDFERSSGLPDPRPRPVSSSLDPSDIPQSSSPTTRSPRNRSPYRRGHGRSYSTNSPAAPPMVRAHSSPAYTHRSDYRSSSPLRSPGRVRSPFRIPTEEEPSLVASPSAMFDIEAISEDAELDLTPRPTTAEKPPTTSAHLYLSPSPSPSTLGSPQFTPSSGSGISSSTFNLNSSSSSFRLGRRRPTSPLHQVSHAGLLSHHSSGTTTTTSTTRSSSANSSPLLEPSKFNESFPSELPLHHARSFSSSSVPSTPTSMRSRSPSISSLETIPDTPDAEEAAAAQDRLDRESGVVVRRGSLDMPGQRSGGGFGFGGRDKRKRWSVCGAEIRGDLDLETIWED